MQPLLSCLVLSLLLAAPAAAETVVLDFEEEAPGGRPNGFVSAEWSCVRIGESRAREGRRALRIGALGEPGRGQGLAVGDEDDGAALVLEFSVPVTSLRLTVGNDEAELTAADSLALLRVFRAGAPVGDASVRLDRDDRMSQMVEVSAVGEFDRAVLVYASESGGVLALDELVDDITFEPTQACAAGDS